jgi:hypothetical protein
MHKEEDEEEEKGKQTWENAIQARAPSMQASAILTISRSNGEQFDFIFILCF